MIVAPFVGNEPVPSYFYRVGGEVMTPFRYYDMSQTDPMPLDRFDVGRTHYLLKRTAHGFYSKGCQGDREWMFLVDAFGREYLGYGENREAAESEWRNKVHGTFQSLYRKRPFQMTDAEVQQWLDLQDVIDVAAYVHAMPLEIHEIGRVTGHRRGYPDTITWVDGREETVQLDQMPTVFASYKPGQWFEAISLRGPQTLRLREVLSCERLPGFHIESAGLATNNVDAIRGTNSYPESDSDWSQR